MITCCLQRGGRQRLSAAAVVFVRKGFLRVLRLLLGLVAGDECGQRRRAPKLRPRVGQKQRVAALCVGAHVADFGEGKNLLDRYILHIILRSAMTALSESLAAETQRQRSAAFGEPGVPRLLCDGNLPGVSGAEGEFRWDLKVAPFMRQITLPCASPPNYALMRFA